MTLYSTEWTITSDITPEWAIRVPQDGANEWQLSWLHDRLITRDQALIGMELDELLSDPDGVHDHFYLAKVEDYADCLGVIPENAIVLLAIRIIARLHTAESIESYVRHLEG